MGRSERLCRAGSAGARHPGAPESDRELTISRSQSAGGGPFPATHIEGPRPNSARAPLAHYGHPRLAKAEDPMESSDSLTRGRFFRQPIGSHHSLLIMYKRSRQAAVHGPTLSLHQAPTNLTGFSWISSRVRGNSSWSKRHRAFALPMMRSSSMAKPSSLPSHAVRLTTFAELEPYVHAFSAGHLNLLMIFGPPGVGKSRLVRQALGRQVCWIGGQATPFGIYLQAYEHRHKPIVLDDVDGLYADRLGIRLLKALGQTERTKTVSWHTAAPTLGQCSIPRQFTTTSRVVLIGNEWKTLNEDGAAWEGGGHLLAFEPRPLEVHRQAAPSFSDQEISDFFADLFHLLAHHS